MVYNVRIVEHKLAIKKSKFEENINHDSVSLYHAILKKRRKRSSIDLY